MFELRYISSKITYVANKSFKIPVWTLVYTVHYKDKVSVSQR